MQEDGGSRRDAKHVVILGGGIVGAAVAYYLRQTHQERALPFGLQLTIVESATATQRCACGKPGCEYTSLHALGANSGSSSGFLEKDTCDGTPMEALARQGFEAHVELGKQLDRSADDQVGFRRLQRVAYSGTAGGRFGQEQAVYERPSPKPWTSVAQNGQVMSGSTFCKTCTTTFAAQTSDASRSPFKDATPCAQTDRGSCAAPKPAQVHPRKLCWALAKLSGAVVVSGTEVLGVEKGGATHNTQVITAVRVRPSSYAWSLPEPEPELELQPPESEPEQKQEQDIETSPQILCLGEGQGIWPAADQVSTAQATPHTKEIWHALPSGRLSCTHVVVALGAWSATAITEGWFEQQELRLPLIAVLEQSLVARPQEELLVDIKEGGRVTPQAVAISAAARELVLPPPLPIRESACNATKVNLVHFGDAGSFVPFVLPRSADAVPEVWVGGAVERMGSVVQEDDRSGKPRMILKSARHLADGDGYENALVVGALRSVAVELAPVLAEAQHVSQSACVRSHTPDGLPIISAVPHCGKLQPSVCMWDILSVPLSWLRLE